MRKDVIGFSDLIESFLESSQSGFRRRYYRISDKGFKRFWTDLWDCGHKSGLKEGGEGNA
ncbi:MAG: hypothetical protein IJ174_02555 [Clostridia bacterium]|nr:hypothetical protein [Clostridia bacterium]